MMFCWKSYRIYNIDIGISAYRSLTYHAQDDEDDESTVEAPDAGTTSDLEELDSSLSSTAPSSIVSGATGSTESSSSSAKLDRLIQQLKNLKVKTPVKSGCKGASVEHESPDVSSKKDVGHTPSSSDSSLSPKQRLALYFQRKKAEKSAQNLGVTENPKVEVGKDAKSSLKDPAAPDPQQNRYVLPDHATCFTGFHIFIWIYVYVYICM